MNRDRIFAALATLAVLTGLALGFRELGSPRTQRSVNADIARSLDLEGLSQVINNAHRINQKLPVSLDELKKTNPSLRIADPETKTPYSYSVLGEKQYQLCAVYTNNNSAHPAGTFCQTYVASK